MRLPSAALDPHGPAQTYKRCQRMTCGHPTDGCPSGTLYVSKSDPRANFTTIQSAIESVGNTTASPAYILIAPGNYTEQLNVTRRGPLHLIGMSKKPWKGEVYSDVDTDTAAQNDVQVWWNSANHDAIFSDNVFTSVLTVGPTFNATLTGAGPTGFPVPEDTPFGCSDFRAYNIDFRNEYTPYSNGPAHAIGVSRANAGFYSCGFYSWQDTVYIGKLGNAYFYDAVVAGQTDFLYGFGTLYIEKSHLALRSCGGGITAWKGTNTTFPNKYGVYIDRTPSVAANASIAAKIVGKCPLGRPWNAQHRSIFMDSYFDASIKPAGYVIWGATDQRVNNYTLMATWRDYGPGYNETAERESGGVTKVLSDEEVRPYRYPVDVFQTEKGDFGFVEWIDQSVLFSQD
ncbi:pectin lyase fold/virulence factor [Coniochaeta sp. 2T2.1]|nr:pectin lyase fold/virulence factor [Coniochaeta sp. 2T2.1]